MNITESFRLNNLAPGQFHFFCQLVYQIITSFHPASDKVLVFLDSYSFKTLPSFIFFRIKLTLNAYKKRTQYFVGSVPLQSLKFHILCLLRARSAGLEMNEVAVNLNSVAVTKISNIMIVSSKEVIDVLTISEYLFIQSMNVATKDSTYFNIKTEYIFPRRNYKRKKPFSLQ